MDPKIAARFNDNILHDAMGHYGISLDKISKLDGYESFIYEFEREDGKFILRIGHSSRRTPAHIHGEVDWINYLASNGVGVARTICSSTGELVELIPDGNGEYFLCTAFVRAPGREVPTEQENERFYCSYGQLIGKMHSLAKTYTPSNPAWKRYAWDDPINNTGDRELPANEQSAIEKYGQVLAHLRTLQREPEGYGIIHQDAHAGNFFVDEDYNITLFDFDDCVYGHFIYDIAMVAFYVSTHGQDRGKFMLEFMPPFLAGYREENRLDPKWLAEIPWFMKLREIELFASILHNDGENPANPWIARFMQGRREKILADVPFCEFDWETLTKFL